jgi:hypothetical protein
VHRVAQFGRANCNGSREDANDAKNTIATNTPISATPRNGIQRHALHAVRRVAKSGQAERKPQINTDKCRWIPGLRTRRIQRHPGTEFSDTLRTPCTMSLNSNGNSTTWRRLGEASPSSPQRCRGSEFNDTQARNSATPSAHRAACRALPRLQDEINTTVG